MSFGRTFVVIRHWLTHYWSHDFMTSRTLRFMLCTFLSQLRTHPLILASPRDERIIKNLRNILKRQRKFHSSENDDVNTNTDTSQNSAPRNSIQSVHWKNASAKTSIVQLTSEGYRALPKQSSRNCRKDSAIGLIHAAPFKELKPSASTPALPFLTKSRRLSTSSQRSVTEGNAWTAKMNFSIKTIKRSVPSMYHSILHGITPANELSSPERCLCEHNRPRKTSGSLVRSASRIFDSKKKDYKEIMNIPRTSVSTPTTSSSREDPDHPNPLCPLHTIQTPTPTPTPSPLAVPLRSLRRTESFSSQSEIDYSTLTSSSYRPLVLHYRSEVIAQQFCLIEQSMLQSVTWDELAELRWRKHRSKMTNGLVDVGSINSQEGEDDGQTQSTLMQILLGLQSPAVSRLEKTWQRIDHYEMQIFGELKDMAKPFRNWKNIRDAMTKATEDVAESSAVECVLTQSRADPVVRQTKGCIPFLGLYLSDLVFNAELPTYINAKEDIAASDASPKDEDLSVRLSMHMVNYNKFRIIASVIRHVLAFQVLSRIYTFIIHPELLSALQNMLFLDNAEIRKASFLCEE
ncbi:Guanine nucleotide exchange factor lte1 [Apophysomyces sp. BC1034]|nr:Guanine nucleotide exchange factor lte1 [Apophysomyces sp. BC1021]KAG0186420.1 Guanine nucleotide exchange factor lte1 [Apophysomyces sp. BC1034]